MSLLDVDFLLIGQGLAGSLLGWELIKQGFKIIIVDNGDENASQVASGLINPVTGMRLVKSAGLDRLLHSARHYYADLEAFFQQRFYYERTMLRVLRNQQEFETAEKRLRQTGYQPFLANIIANSPGINSPLGLLIQKQTGYLTTRPLILALKTYFIERGSYLKTQVDYHHIQLQPHLQWQHIKPAQIIFCEGYLGTRNPWFKHLPFQPVKGEILTAETAHTLVPNMLNYGHWFIPLPEQRFKTGATFDREQLNRQPTEQAKKTLLSDLWQIYPALKNARTIDQQAGIRPATLDKQPFIGHHPKYSQLAIFNGFGAKGSLQIPLFCQTFADSLRHHIELPPGCNIRRYYDSHFPA